MNRIRFGKSNKNEFSSIFKVNVGIVLVSFSLGIWGGMKVQCEQSYFEHTIDEVDFEYDLATDDRYESKNPDGSVTKKRNEKECGVHVNRKITNKFQLLSYGSN